MLLIRRFEEKAGQLYGMGLIGGFCHLYIGQEAVVIGMQMALKEGDQIITGYRDHGHMLACGMDAKGVMAELTGRRGGLSKGKGGSMHMFSKEKQFYGGRVNFQTLASKFAPAPTTISGVLEKAEVPKIGDPPSQWAIDLMNEIADEQKAIGK